MTMKESDGQAETPTVQPMLEDDFGFAFGVVFRAYARCIEATVADLPGGLRGYFILAAAVRGEACSQRFIAHRMGMDRTMMTYLLDDMEEAGLVERKPDPADRRSRQIISTDTGEEVYEALHTKVLQIDQVLLSELPEESRAAFRETLYAVARRVTLIEETNPGELGAELTDTKKPARATRRRQARPNI